MNTKQLIEETVSLPVEKRTLVVDSLLRSLNQPDSDIDEAWAKEAKRRLDEFRSGQVSAIPGEEVFKNILGRLSQ